MKEDIDRRKLLTINNFLNLHPTFKHRVDISFNHLKL